MGEKEMSCQPLKWLKLTFLLTLLIANTAASFCQKQNTSEPISSSRSIVALLPGYKMQIIPGIDSAAGSIWRNNGLTIDIELCCGFGNAAASIDKKDLVWREEQNRNGQLVVCAYTKSKELIVSYPKRVTNFRVKIKNQEDLIEALMIILSYEPDHGYPVDPSSIVPPPKSP